MNSLRELVSLVAANLILLCVEGRTAVFHVSTNGNDALSGSSWPLAKRTVASAVAAANGGDSIWVAAGRYPERITTKPDVALYGGFAGVETTVTQRNWQTNLSILDGTRGSVVLNITNAGPATRIDGMVIIGGLGPACQGRSVASRADTARVGARGHFAGAGASGTRSSRA